jgi:hypothetical protein
MIDAGCWMLDEKSRQGFDIGRKEDGSFLPLPPLRLRKASAKQGQR